MSTFAVAFGVLALACQVEAATAQEKELPRWLPQNSGTTARLRGVCAVSEQVAWASGTGGTFARTTDGGTSWTPGKVQGAAELDFRDVEAFDARTAVLLSSGPGPQSRVYRTSDAGESWTLSFTNPDPGGFLDAIAFWDAGHGLAFGDPVEGRFRVFLTDDGGASWHASDPSGMPPALGGEGAFAASGTCLVTLKGTRRAWFATGGGGVARVFRTVDGGRTWAAAEARVKAATPSSGIFSLAFRDADHGAAIGGDYKRPDDPSANLALTEDGGKTWSLVPTGPPGYRSAVAYLAPTSPASLVTVGPTASDLSNSDGFAWRPIAKTGFHAVSLVPSKLTGWAVGDDGRIARLVTTP